MASDSLNARLLQFGILGGDPTAQVTIAGVCVGEGSPLVQVALHNGRYYLKNGFHRVYGLGTAGATSVPCIMVEATDYSQVGARGGDGTFERGLLESANQPTCGHFIQGRAFSVPIRRFKRVITVTWTESSFPVES